MFYSSVLDGLVYRALGMTFLSFFLNKLGRRPDPMGRFYVVETFRMCIYVRMCGCNKVGLTRAWLFLKCVDQLIETEMRSMTCTLYPWSQKRGSSSE